MSIQRDIRDNKIQRNLAGGILSDSGNVSNKILHIDNDDQFPNRIHKNDTNEVSQITDKAQNIAFTGSCGFDYDNGFVFDGVNDFFVSGKNNINIFEKDFTIDILHSANKTTSCILGKWASGVGTVNEWGIVTLSSSIDFRFSHDGTNNNITSVEWGGATFNQGDTQRTIVIFKKGVTTSTLTLISGFIDNGIFSNFIVRDKKTVNNIDLPTILANDIYLGKFINDAISPYTGNILKIEINTSLLIDPESVLIGDDFNYLWNEFTDFKGFNYHKRYKDGEFYLSSKYLKDAVIDTDNRIERIYNSIKDTYFEQTVLANRPRRTNQGIEYLSGESLTQAVSDEYTYGTDDFFLGRWVNFKNESVVFSIGGIIEIGIDATNIYVETSGGKLYANRANAINEGFKYIGFHRENGSIYISIGGCFENSRVENVDYNTDQIATIGGAFIGTDTDMYNVKESIISFVGKVQNNKVFEPPRRGGFNSDIKQY